VSYVLVYPETGDLVLAGPAGNWQTAANGAIVSIETGRPVVRLDDLLSRLGVEIDAPARQTIIAVPDVPPPHYRI